MKKVVGDGNPLLGLPLPVVSPEVVAWLFGVLSLFCQNKLDDVSPCRWMLQKTSFADGPHGRGSLFGNTKCFYIYIYILENSMLF
jgi:hypothetical protein